MVGVDWIKITTDMFDNRKIRYIRTLPEGNNIVLIWVMLLTMAGRCNSSGMIFLTENIPYSTKILADELGFEENVVKIAIASLEKLNMVTTDAGFMCIPGWGEYQNIESLDKIREQTKQRVRKYRENQRQIASNATCNVTVTECNAIEEDKERELEEERDKEREKRVSYQLVADLYNNTCVSFPRIEKLSDARKKAIKARLNTYSMDDFEKLFQMAEESDFLKGGNSRNWSANFDWLIKDANMAKVLDGNYKNKARQEEPQSIADMWKGVI